MKKFLWNLQLFGEGGDAGASDSTGSDVGASGEQNGMGDSKPSLANVVYGKQAKDGLLTDPNAADTDAAPKDKSQLFEDLIKGEYKDEFAKRTQKIINSKFKETKSLQETVNSYTPIMTLLGQIYGLDASDVAGLQKALEDDDSLLEEEAMSKGLSVEQLRRIKALERENDNLRHAVQAVDAREQQTAIYQGWLQEADALKEKFGLENFDLEAECQNPDFVELLQAPNITMEQAYKVVHMDELMNGAMNYTAAAVKERMASNIASRQARPSENGVSPLTTQVMKPDVKSLTVADMEEIERRVARGEVISF